MGLDGEPAFVDNIELVSQDGGKFVVPRHIAILSKVVKTMTEGDKTETSFPLPK